MIQWRILFLISDNFWAILCLFFSVRPLIFRFGRYHILMKLHSTQWKWLHKKNCSILKRDDSNRELVLFFYFCSFFYWLIKNRQQKIYFTFIKLTVCDEKHRLSWEKEKKTHAHTHTYSRAIWWNRSFRCISLLSQFLNIDCWWFVNAIGQQAIMFTTLCL